jgi:cephalosporin hydroxylase
MNPIEAFALEREEIRKKINQNKPLQAATQAWMNLAQEAKYSYQFDWLGRPIIQYPQDIVAMQELIWKVKPDLIIETGIAHGGSLIFSASMLALIDMCEASEAGKTIDPKSSHRKVLGIDIDIRAHYCIVFDTVVENMPEAIFPDRPWGPGNNPMTAANEFLAKHPQYTLDTSVHEKILISVAPRGYYKKIK